MRFKRLVLKRHTKSFALVSALCLTAIGSGCTSFRAVETSASVPTGETVLVLGVKPQNYRVQLFPGVVKDGEFRESVFRMAAFYGAPTDGYIVGKAKPGDTLAIMMIRQVANANDIGGIDFRPCNGVKTMVFQVPMAAAVYLGDITYLARGRELEVRYSEDLAAAQSHLVATYPSLGVELQKADYKLMPAQASCSGVVVIPVYY